MASIIPILQRYSLLFWDFDGVIKESVAVKTEAYVRLFRPFGPSVAADVLRHHEGNGGMSRFDKIPLYLGWAGQPATAVNVADYCDRFAGMVRKAVIDSKWVPGAREYLATNYGRQSCVIITATPQSEIEGILDALDIGAWFHEVHGAPLTKGEAIASVLQRRDVNPMHAIMIGDSKSDMQAAVANNIAFLLRRTELNLDLQLAHAGAQCEDFNDE